MALEALQRFNDLLLQYQRIERVMRVPGTERNENDVEHSYMLTMLAWYLIEKDKLSLNKDLVIKYALVHDLVEVYAGDTYIYDEEARKTKHEREGKAAQRLALEFPDFSELHTLIAEYERQDTAESRFVRALDKLHPMLCIYVDGGRFWKEKRVSLDMIITAKREIVECSPEVKPYFDSFVEHLRTRPELFGAHA